MGKRTKKDDGLSTLWYIFPFALWIIFGHFFGLIGILLGLILAFLIMRYFNKDRKEDVKHVMKTYTIGIFGIIVFLIIFFFLIYPMLFS